MWDFSRKSDPLTAFQQDDGMTELKHALYCRQGITSLSWHDFSGNRNDNFCSEIVSTHADLASADCSENKMALWQVNQVPADASAPDASSEKKYHFTKVKDFFSNFDDDRILAQAVSPCG